ncbi:MAG: hypothetical protein KAI47_13125 [Deltaproteobacteria bacterium]|nr:hypothetical protein [Deltaproteobacteria bacterium]
MIPRLPRTLLGSLALTALILGAPPVAAGPAPHAKAPKVRRAGPKSPRVKPTVAVLYFTYEGADKEMVVLRKGLAEMLITDLAQVDAVRVVERTRLEALLKELKLNQSRKIDRRGANRLGKLLGARYLIWGSYFKTFGSFCLTAKVIEVERGVTLPGGKACGKPTDFLALYKKVETNLETTLETRLQATPRTPKTRKHGHSMKTRRARARAHVAKRRAKMAKKGPARLTTRTALAYAQALDARDRGDVRVARKTLKKLLRDQPDFTQAKHLLASLSRR